MSVDDTPGFCDRSGGLHRLEHGPVGSVGDARGADLLDRGGLGLGALLQDALDPLQHVRVPVGRLAGQALRLLEDARQDEAEPGGLLVVLRDLRADDTEEEGVQPVDSSTQPLLGPRLDGLPVPGGGHHALPQALDGVVEGSLTGGLRRLRLDVHRGGGRVGRLGALLREEATGGIGEPSGVSDGGH